MSKMTLTKTRLIGGVWEGELAGAGPGEPQISVTHLGDEVPGIQLEQAGDIWLVRVPVPAALISDGVQTFIISDETGQMLSSFALLAGDALAEDIRAELDLLRGELDMLKRSFRRHCNES